jgi:holo-[acyl-carrier protein] synthase
MKIIGIGVDIVENKRIRSLINKKNFLARTFGKSEILNSKKVKNKVNYFSKRFASKEALSKAIGTGISEGLNFKDIEVANNSHGKPYFLNNFKLKNFIIKKKKIKNFNLFLSISDEKEYSIAFAIIQTK